jgi:drug/metabolite transporter (DMT)-like permease
MPVPDLLLSSTLVVAAFGLIASLGWGIADFGGGLASMRAPVLGVLFTSQLFSLIVAIPMLLLVTEPPMAMGDVLLAALGGSFGAFGLALLYRGLSVGRMGVVAPIAAVITAGMPVAVGFVTEGIPSALVIVGIVLAGVGVVLVSVSPAPPGGGPSGLVYGLGAGFLFGLFPILTSGIADEVLAQPVVTVRIASILSIAAFLLVRRPAWQVPRRLWPAMFGLGIVDMIATAAFLAAISIGPLAIAAVLTSLYPVVTVILAALVLRERISALHAVGIAAAATAVVLIAVA